VLGSVIGISPPANEVVAVQIPRLSHSFPQRRSPASARAAANAAFAFSWCVFTFARLLHSPLRKT
jgi:hypothetical protein